MLEQAAKAAGEEEKQDGTLSLGAVGGGETLFSSPFWWFCLLVFLLVFKKFNSKKGNFLELLLWLSEGSKQRAQCIPSTDRIGKYLWCSKAVCALSLIHRCIGSSAEGAGGTWLSAGWNRNWVVFSVRMEVDISGFLLGVFETVWCSLLAAWREDEPGGRGEECCCEQQGCSWALVRLKGGKGELQASLSKFSLYNSLSARECVGMHQPFSCGHADFGWLTRAGGCAAFLGSCEFPVVPVGASGTVLVLSKRQSPD